MTKFVRRLLLSILLPLSCHAAELRIETVRPDDFVDVAKAIPEAQLDIRYFSDHNFIGRPIRGYQAPLCLLTHPATVALQHVTDRLRPMGLTLKIYDCYRPQTAVNDFDAWAKQPTQTAMKPEFYPQLDKSLLFEQGYIAYRSGHSRGSTVDLTIVPRDSKVPLFDAKQPLVSCTAPQARRFPDNSLDFGTGYDCFSPLAHPDNPSLSDQQRANRLLLRSLMQDAGFKPLDTEWWHFTLEHEPYPDTYFDFPIR